MSFALSELRATVHPPMAIIECSSRGNPMVAIMLAPRRATAMPIAPARLLSVR
jgi:hypothetical protein